MSDAGLALLGAARTILGRAAIELDDGECKQRVSMALASVNDAIEEREDELERKCLACGSFIGHSLGCPRLEAWLAENGAGE